MAIIKWNRLLPMRGSSLLDDDLWPNIVWPEALSGNGMDIYETDNEVVVEAQVPGIPEDKVEVTVEGNVLTINATYQESDEEKSHKKTVYKSTRQTSFNYSTSLPRLVDGTKAKAEVENGVIKVIIPKTEAEKPKKIEVKKK